MAETPTQAGERRNPQRGNTLSDLCVLLERARRRLALPALALVDERGLLLGGAGRYAECEQLGALAVGPARARPFVLAFELLGQRVMLCSQREPAERQPLTELTVACRRILLDKRRSQGTNPVAPLRAAL